MLGELVPAANQLFALLRVSDGNGSLTGKQRQAFFIVGVPGLLLALIVRFTLSEPQRGASEQRLDSGSRPQLIAVLRFLGARRSFIYMAVAAGLSAFVGYSVVNFMPSFIDRSFGVGIAVIGFWLGMIYGIAGGAGFYFDGKNS